MNELHHNPRLNGTSAITGFAGTFHPLYAVYRALTRHHNTGQDPETISIIVNRLLPAEHIRSSPGDLRAPLETRHRMREVLKDEYLFESATSRQYSQHLLSLETLFSRGMPHILAVRPSTDCLGSWEEMQDTLVKQILEPDPYDTGCWIGDMACAFGLEACTFGFGLQIFRDCLGSYRVNHDAHSILLYTSDWQWILGFGSMCEIERGMRDQVELCLRIQPFPRHSVS